jgi:hypothetical protein
MKTGVKRQLTNVTGGAFMPSVDQEGNILYAGYTSSGYKIFSISKEEQGKAQSTGKYVRLDNPPFDKLQPNGDISKFDIASLRGFDDNTTPEFNKKNIQGHFQNFLSSLLSGMIIIIHPISLPKRLSRVFMFLQ